VKRDIKIEAVYPNTIKDVWHALTDPASLAGWLMENDFKPLPGHRFHFRSKSRFGLQRSIACQVLVVEAPRILSWSWGNEGSVVTFRLAATAEGTRLRLEHTGLRGARGLALAWLLGHGWGHKIEQRLPTVLADNASMQISNERRE
jgi:uncharacterized protein YndB with AHSA1/START domain